MMLNPHKKFTSLFHLIPLDAEHTRIEIIIYQSPAQFRDIPYRSDEFRKGFDIFMEEDFAICRQLQAGVHSRAYRVTQLAEEHEVGVGHFYTALTEYQL